jgi:hypothetical protein
LFQHRVLYWYSGNIFPRQNDGSAAAFLFYKVAFDLFEKFKFKMQIKAEISSFLLSNLASRGVWTW